MRKEKELLAIYKQAKGDNQYYSFEDFKRNAKEYLKDVKDGQTYCSIKVSKSGMTRNFNFHKYNMLLNICYNKKFNWDAVKVDGCGMDMHWYLKFRTCGQLFTKKEVEKYMLNSMCSSGVIL